MTCTGDKCYLNVNDTIQFVYEVSNFNELDNQIVPNRYMCKNLKTAFQLIAEIVNNTLSEHVPEINFNEEDLNKLNPSLIFSTNDTIQFGDNITIRQFELFSEDMVKNEPVYPPPIKLPQEENN